MATGAGSRLPASPLIGSPVAWRVPVTGFVKDYGPSGARVFVLVLREMEPRAHPSNAAEPH